MRVDDSAAKTASGADIGVFRRIAEVLVSRRRTVLLCLAVVAIISAIGMPRLESDFTVDELFADVGGQRQVTAAARAHFGNTDNTLLLVLEYPKDEGEKTLASDWSGRLRQIARLSSLAAKVEGVRGVTSLATITLNSPEGLLLPGQALTSQAAERRVEAALATPLARGLLISADRSVTVIAVALETSVSRADDLSVVVGAIDEIARAAAIEDGRISLGGLPFVRVEVVRAMNRDQLRLLPIGFGICLLVLFVAFRWWPAIVMPLVAVGIASLMCVGAMAWSGTTMTVVTNIVPLLIVIIGVSDSIHLIARYLEERSLGSPAKEAASVATSQVMLACLLTSVTTAIGFVSLLSSSISMLRVFGMVAAVGVSIAFIVTITFLPATLASIGAPPKKSSGAARTLSLAPITTWMLAHRWVVLALFAAASGAASYSLRYLEVDEGVRRQFDKNTEAGKTMTVLERHLGGLRPLDVLLASSSVGRFKQAPVLAALDEITQFASERTETLSARSLGDVVREIRYGVSGGKRGRDEPIAAGDDTAALVLVGNAAGNAPDLATPSYQHARIAVSMADLGSKLTLEFADDLRAHAIAKLAPFPDITIELGGEGYASSLGLESLIRDLARSLAIAIFGIAVILALAFRSARWALVGLLPSGLPIVFGLAYMTARGIPLGTATVIVFSVALGLAVDGTIHVLARFREELRGGHSREQALVSAVDGSGRAIIATCITLVVGFGILGLSSFIPMRQFGELIAISIGGSLLCQLVLLPPLLVIVGGGGEGQEARKEP